MLEDSIMSSPSKSNKSIPEPIIERKKERNKSDDILELNSDHEQIVDLHKIIQHFYYDSYDEYLENEGRNSKSLVVKTPAIIKNYKPFEMERSLVIADHMSRYKIEQNKRNFWPETQGFTTCKSLIKLEREQQFNDISDNYNKNNAFFITDAELIMCCDNVEKSLQSNTLKEIDNGNSITEELSPKKNYPSPLSKEQTIIYTPEFRLRRQPEKTYSRKFSNTTKTNLNKLFEEQTSAVSDDDHSDFYSLSIQDDFTVGELSNDYDVTLTSTNNIQCFCDDNLLNLSVNFTQNNQILSDDYQYDHHEYRNLFSDKMSDLYYDLYNSFEEFHGSRSQRDIEKASIDIENAELESSPTTLNITHEKEQTRIYTPEFRLRRKPEKTYNRKFSNTSKTNLKKRFEEQTLSIQDDFTVGELANDHDITLTSTNNIQCFCDDNLLNLSVNFTQNNQILSDDYQYDHHEYRNLFSDKMSDLYYDLYNSFEEFHGSRSQRDVEKASIDIENVELESSPTTLNITHEKENATYWNEDDCNDVFAYINTENILHEENENNQRVKQANVVEFAVIKSKTNNENLTGPVNLRQDLTSKNSVGFKTASSKSIKVSREANILSKLPDIPAIKKYANANNCDTGNVNEDVKFIENLEEYDWNDDSDLFQNFQTSKGKHEIEQVQQHKTNVLQIPQQVQVKSSPSKMSAQGFKTAGGKSLPISKKTLDFVENLLKEFASDNKDNYNCVEDLNEIKCKAYAKTHNFKSKQSSLRDIQEINKEQLIGSNIKFQTAKEQTRIYTPEFRLRRQPEKTYSRKFSNTSKTNLKKRVEEQISAVSDDDHSDFYSLSIQDDFTVGELSSVNFTKNNQIFSDDYQYDHQEYRNLFSDKMSDLYHDLYNSLEEFRGSRSQRDAEEAGMDIENAELESSPTTLNITHEKEQTRIYTPEFRLRRQPEKTYSRKFSNTSKTNLKKRFDEQTLSIQDDFTVGELSNDHDVALTSTNNIQCFCDDNLLNLSVNFTQNNQILSDDYQYDHQEYRNLFSDKMSDLYYDLYNSFDEFRGYRSQRDVEKASIVIENAELESSPTTLNITHEKENANYKGWNEDDCNDVFAYINTENTLHDENENNQNVKQENVVEFAVTKSPTNNKNLTGPVNLRQDLTSKNSVGFKTASSKSIKVSREANIMTANILSKLPDIPAINKYTHSNNCDTGNVNEDAKFFQNLEDYDWNDDSDLFQNFQTSKGKHEIEQVQQQTNVLRIPQQVQVKHSPSKMSAQGFKTAGGKNLHISKKAIDFFENLLKEFAGDNKDNYNCVEDLNEIKCKVYAKTHNFKSKQSSLNDTQKINMENKEQIIGSNIAIKTANENTTYEGWDEDDCNDVFAYINVENILHDQNKKQEFALNKSKNNNENSTVPVNLRRNLTSNNTKIPAITKKAGANNCDTRNFIEDVNSFEPEDFECNDDCDLFQNYQTQITSKGKHATLSECPINPNNIIQQNTIPKPIDRATPGASTLLPTKVINRGLYKSKSLFAELSLKSPFIPVRNSLTILNEEIPKVNKEKYDFNADVETPIKSSVSLGDRVQTPATPNLREFISNAALTSTPLINVSCNLSQTIKDTDFKPITWKNNNSITNKSANCYNHTTSFLDSSSLNITLNSSNPSEEERTDCLKIFGKPPEVSPILKSTYNNCRPSGLRRNRGMLKKTEK